jgi:hypothetical protein
MSACGAKSRQNLVNFVHPGPHHDVSCLISPGWWTRPWPNARNAQAVPGWQIDGLAPICWWAVSVATSCGTPWPVVGFSLTLYREAVAQSVL